MSKQSKRYRSNVRALMKARVLASIVTTASPKVKGVQELSGRPIGEIGRTAIDHPALDVRSQRLFKLLKLLGGRL